MKPMKKLLIALSIIFTLTIIITVNYYKNKIAEYKEHIKSVHNEAVQYKFDSEVFESTMNALTIITKHYKGCVDYIASDTNIVLTDSARIMITLSESSVNDELLNHITKGDSLLIQANKSLIK